MEIVRPQRYPDVPSAGHDLPGKVDMVMRIARLQDHERNEAFTRLQESIKDLPSGEAQRVLSEIVDRDLNNEADHETWFGISKVLTHDEAQASSSLSGACMRVPSSTSP